MGFLGDVGNIVTAPAQWIFGQAQDGLNKITPQTTNVPNYVNSPGLQQNPFSQSYGQNAANNRTMAENYQQNGANYLGQENAGAQGQTAQQQQALAKALQSQAMGQGPSASQTMLQQAMAQNASNATGMAAASRGVNPALAMRQAMQSNAAANQAGIQQGIAARQQEQVNAQGMLGNTLSGMRNQDQSNTAMMGQLAQGQGQLALGQGQLANSQDQMALDASKANLSGNLTASGINAGIAENNTKTAGQVLGGAINGAGAIAGMALAQGGMVPGHAQVHGDSYSNDTVTAKLSPGEIVIPRSKASNPEMAKEFLDHLMKSKKGKSGGGFGKVLEAHRKLGEALESLQPKGGKKNA